MIWNFVVLVDEGLDVTYIIERPDVAYIHGHPNNLVVQHVFPLVLDGCNYLLCVMSYNVTLMLHLHSINHKWRWLISSTPNFAVFHDFEHRWSRFQGRRQQNWFENKCSQSTTDVWSSSKDRLLWSPTSTQLLVTIFSMLTAKELITLKCKSREVGYMDMNPNIVDPIIVYYPPKAGLYLLAERWRLLDTRW